jgi:hypothetical protein
VAAEYVPAPQSRHVASVEAPTVVEYLPAPQSVQRAAPKPVLYFPAPQAVHVPPLGPVNPRLQTQLASAGEPIGACVSAGQAWQALCAVAATVVEYVLTLQSVHAAAPVTILYFPAAHAVHVPPLGPVNPRLQRQEPTAVCDASACPEFAPQDTQVLATVAPTVAEYVLASQLVHAAEPVAVLYLPAAHAVHVPPLGPANPRLQTQLASAVDPTGACVFEGHPRQVAIAVAPVAVEYVLAPQSVHAAEPVDVLYFPATHKTHDSASGPVDPAGQSETQAVNASLPAGENVLAPQLIQVEATKAPVAVEYLPASQSVHATLPMICLYLPAAHAVHVPLISPVYPVLH